MVFPQFWGKKWRRSEHALASNTVLSLFPPGFQAHFQGGVRGSPGTGLRPIDFVAMPLRVRKPARGVYNQIS